MTVYILIMAAIMGAADVDPFILGLTQQVGTTLSLDTAALADGEWWRRLRGRASFEANPPGTGNRFFTDISDETVLLIGAGDTGR